MAEMTALTLANICLDVQIDICMYLHPSDILALRKTCKALQPSTRQRVVWEAALHRVCIDNTLFLPSFRISNMSNLELENTAMAPRRWIEFCRRLDKRDLNNPGAVLRPQATKYSLDNSISIDPPTSSCRLFLVPGGRYLVIYSPNISDTSDSISVLDLRYSTSANCKLIASVKLEAKYQGWPTYIKFTVQATPDGMGLIIFLCNVYTIITIFEIYPQSTAPNLTKIAHLEFDLPLALHARILTGTFTVIWYTLCRDRVVFRVWDYRLKQSINFFVDVERFEPIDFDSENYPEVIATKTAIIVLCETKVLIWAIPDLLPVPVNFLHRDPASTTIPPLFTIPLPNDIDLRFFGWRTMSPWYFGSSNTLCFNMLYENYTTHEFRIILEPNLSSVNLQVNSMNAFTFDHGDTDNNSRVCEDLIFSCQIFDLSGWSSYTNSGRSAPSSYFAVSHSSSAAKIILPGLGRTYGSLLSCPASGTFLLTLLDLDKNDCLFALDFY